MHPDRASTFKAGIFVIIAGVVAILSIVALGQRRQIFVPQYRLAVTFQNAAGLIRGAAVRIAGVNVGTVREVAIKKVDGRAIVKVQVEIAESFREFVREDSTASLRTLGPLGDKYVEITIGAPELRVLRDGETIKSEESPDFYAIIEEARSAVQQANQIAKGVSSALAELNKSSVITNLNTTTDGVRRVVEAIEKGPSLAHSMLFDAALVKTMGDLQSTARSLRASTEAVEQRKGALGELVYGQRLTQAVNDLAEAAAAVKAVALQVQKGNGTAHRLIYDAPAVDPLAEFGQAGKRLNELLARMEDGQGTLGMLLADPSVWESLKRVLGGVEESKRLKLLIRYTMKAEGDGRKGEEAKK
jgi:phospholipid/cholesterol/gamma-HCH transport system substrate-binding protein